MRNGIDKVRKYCLSHNISHYTLFNLKKLVTIAFCIAKKILY